MIIPLLAGIVSVLVNVAVTSPNTSLELVDVVTSQYREARECTTVNPENCRPGEEPTQ
jgi:hypothetical protein